MNAFTGVTAVLVASAVGAVAIGLPGQQTWSVWVLVASATILPALAAYNGVKKGRKLGGREGIAWYTMALSMTMMTPVYFAHYVEAFGPEYILISLAYALGALAIVIVPLPNAGPYQRIVASLDAVGIGIVVATATFWVVAGSRLDAAGHIAWTMSDAAIMAMIGYVALRRSQQRGVDWPLFWLIIGVGAYLGGVLVSTVSGSEYYLGHHADFAYFFGMMSFSLAPLVTEKRRDSVSRQILQPVRWAHVLSPYVLVAVLAVALVAHQIATWGDDSTGTVIVLGIVATMILVLVRQLAMIAEQRRKIELEQSGVIATVSHELRTPLTTVVGFLDLLEDWDYFSDEEKIEMVAMMRGQSHVMARVVGDLVAVARQEIEQVELIRTSIRLDDLMQTACSVVPEIGDADVQVEVEMSPGLILTADRGRMMQIITNYLSNAARYGAGRIRIEAFEESGETVIEVHDDGPGVPDIFRLVIWERFERGQQRQSAIPGSGVGLSVARGIARSHGGSTAYRTSEHLGGSCFSVRVPIHPTLLVDPAPLEPAVPA